MRVIDSIIFFNELELLEMRLYDCEQSAQEDIVDSGQEEEYTPKEKSKKSFSDFKF